MNAKNANDEDNKVWDVIVIGGGPAGMMTAGRAGERGHSVLLLEKNPIFGKKLLLTGGGRCNITNNKTNVREMVLKYKTGSKFLYSTFAQHGVTDSMKFFASKGIALKEENEGRLFPVSNSAKTVRDALVTYMEHSKVTVRTRCTVTAITKDEKSGLFYITLLNTKRVCAKKCVVASGGVSHPETGSTGECFTWLSTLGHEVQKNNYALVPISLKDTWVKKLAGIALPECKLTLYCDEKKQCVQSGKVLFTHVGLSGPLVLNLSKTIGTLLSQGTVTLKLDVLPTHEIGELRKTFQTLLAQESNKKIKNVLGTFIPTGMVGPLLKVTGVDGETPNHSLRAHDRTKIVTSMKALTCTVSSLLGAEKAIISSGGILPTEVNFKTMESRLVQGLYIVGDVLNIDRPSGGYSLQLCWSTGYVAGSHI